MRTSEQFERYIKIPSDFEIDRHWTDKGDIAIEDQWNETQKWGKELKDTTTIPYPYTIFRYKQENDKERQNAEEAFRDAPCMAPYVLLLNPQIESIEFDDELNRTM